MDVEATHVRPAAPPAPYRYQYTRADYLSTALIALLALLTRFAGLTSAHVKHTPVFDEKHYVPQAWDMVRSWQNPLIGGIESNPAYGLVVHPPLGKQLIAWGEALFGYTPMGWRFVVALLGVATIVATMELARRISHSWVVAFFAGFILTFDGVLLVASKFGMLDMVQVFFIVIAALLLAIDHEQVHHRFHNAWVNGTFGTSAFGPRLGFRWWRFGAGVALGLALSVKWSGLYYIAFFGLMTVFMDLSLRKRYGVKRYVVGTLMRDTIPALGSIVVIPALIYLWSWRAWFASETSVYRHSAVDGTIDSDSFLNHLPAGLAGWLHYHFSVLEFHAELTTSNGHSHPWDSKPWAWLAATRPILYYSSTDITCMGTKCRSMIYLFGTPAIWWLTVPVLAWGLYRLVIHHDKKMVIPLVAFAAGWLPWLAAYDRQMYFFYATALVPFTAILLALACGMLLEKGTTIPWLTHITGRVISTGTLAAIGYLALVLSMFIYFAPLLYGIVIPDWWYNQLMWLPSWH